jgi:phosphate transport system permease protein
MVTALELVKTPEPSEPHDRPSASQDGPPDRGGRPPLAPRPKARPRRIRRYTPEDWLTLVGSLAASFALVWVGYLHLLYFSGVLGFAVCWYLVFVVLYAAVVAVSNPRPVVVERLVAATLYLAAAIVIGALGTTIVYVFVKGWSALVHVNFFTHDMAGVAPTAPLTQGGILAAIVGTVIEVAIAVAVSVPLGIGTAVYMTEVGGRGSQLVRTVVEAMTALPEILAGLFIYVVLIVDFGLSKSGLAVAVAMAVTMTPIIARAGEVALRVVPNGLREASGALGATHWKTVRKVVLPTARAGLATGVILAIARGIGETAIPLITSGASSFLTFKPVGVPMNSLPLFIYTSYTTHEPLALDRGFGAAAVLLTLVLLLFVVIRVLVRDKKGSRR